MNPNPFVSIIMPVRNEERYIERCLRSVLSQDYPAERMEIIVADGMSTDATRKIVKEFQEKNPNVHLIDNPGKIVSPGLNAAIRQAKGEIIVRVDGHCEIASDYVRKCVEYLQNGTADGAGGPIETIGENFISQAIAQAMSSGFGVGGSAFRVGSAGPKFADTIAFPAYTRSVLEKAGPYDEELVRNQDDEYNYRLRKMDCKLLLAPDIRSKYYSRASLTGLWKQYFEYGFWKVRVLQKHPRQMQFRQFIPPVFVLSLLMMSFLSLIHPPAIAVLGLILGVYLALSFLASLMMFMTKKADNIMILPIIFLILHLSYGAGFLTGVPFSLVRRIKS